MLQIKNITSDTLQKRTLVLPDSSSIVLQMYYMPMQYGWFFTSLTYGNFILKNLRISNNVNMLRQWKNIIPFGIGCFSNEDREPFFQEDFSSENSKLFILTTAEVQQYEDFLRG